MSRATVLGDAIVDNLNDAVATGTFSQTFKAERVYNVTFDLKDHKNLQLSVMIPRIVQSIVSRIGNQDHTQVSIIIGKHCKPESLSDIDPLMTFVEEIADHFRDLNFGSASWKSTETVIPYSPEDMMEHRHFAAAIHLIYDITWKNT